jgi:hypothetical protein
VSHGLTKADSLLSLSAAACAGLEREPGRPPLESIAYASNRDRHCERSEAIQGNVGRPTALWIAASLRSSR